MRNEKSSRDHRSRSDERVSRDYSRRRSGLIARRSRITRSSPVRRDERVLRRNSSSRSLGRSYRRRPSMRRDEIIHLEIIVEGEVAEEGVDQLAEESSQ